MFHTPGVSVSAPDFAWAPCAFATIQKARPFFSSTWDRPDDANALGLQAKSLRFPLHPPPRPMPSDIPEQAMKKKKNEMKGMGRGPPRNRALQGTMVQNSQEPRLQYWATTLSIRSLARTTRLLASPCLHRSRTPLRSLVCLLHPARFTRALRCAHSFACSLPWLWDSVS